jgi:hypothetical protein
MRNLTDGACLWIRDRAIHLTTLYPSPYPSVTVMRETQVAKFATVFQMVGRVPLTALSGRLVEVRDLKNKNFYLWLMKY